LFNLYPCSDFLDPGRIVKEKILKVRTIFIMRREIDVCIIINGNLFTECNKDEIKELAELLSKIKKTIHIYNSFYHKAISKGN